MSYYGHRRDRLDETLRVHCAYEVASHAQWRTDPRGVIWAGYGGCIAGSITELGDALVALGWVHADDRGVNWVTMSEHSSGDELSRDRLVAAKVLELRRASTGGGGS